MKRGHVAVRTLCAWTPACIEILVAPSELFHMTAAHCGSFTEEECSPALPVDRFFSQLAGNLFFVKLGEVNSSGDNTGLLTLDPAAAADESFRHLLRLTG